MPQAADFSERDLEHLHRHDIPLDEAHRQLELLRHPPQAIRLDRPCRLGDGITRLPEQRRNELAARFDEAMAAGGAQKFVPASGAASRMFRDLSAPLAEDRPLEREALEARAAAGDTSARRILEFFDNLDRFAFCGELAAATAKGGLDFEALRRQGRYRPLLEVLLEPSGLDYSGLPKGLIPFHRYRQLARTPVQEQMVEAARHIRTADGACRLHFTVPEPFRRRFEEHAAAAAADLGPRLEIRFEVGLSVQAPSTDTLAVDEEGQPFREDDGSLLLRPGGHGALLGNLDALGCDMVFLKNIDNVLPDRLKDPVVRWKKIMGGHLLELRERIAAHLKRLESEPPDRELVADVTTFVRQVLCVEPPTALDASDLEARRSYLLRRLERPLRVCGVVPNEGEPGGGPFWVRGQDGEQTLQIVESAEVEDEQRHVFEGSTHFNPVDLVCGLRDHQGRAFDLERYVNPRAVFIAKKSHQGRPLLALERPGLWNGAMAGWNTLFVEVPGETFAPVKTVFDLLRPEHQ